MKKINGEAKLTFMETTSIIVGHGVGAGILSVPYLASRNSWRDIICAYHNTRKRTASSEICGAFGKLPFQIIVCVSSVLATLGALAKVL